MKQEIMSDNEIPAVKLYKDREIWVGSMLGGPLVAGYMIGENFKAFGERDRIWKTWVISIAVTVLLFVSVLVPQLDRVPGFFFALVYTVIAYSCVRLYQGERIDAHINTGGAVYGWGRIIGIAVLGGILTGALFLAGGFMAGTFSDTKTTKTYGALKHEILFEKDNITEIEVDKLGEFFIGRNFFDNEKQKFTDAKKIGNNYEIVIYCNNSIKSDAEAVGYFIDLRNDMQNMFPGNKISFNLVIDTPDNVVKRLE